MSFGPRKPTAPSRSNRPGIVKKPLNKPVTRNEAPKQQQVVKPKGSSSTVSTSAPKKVVPVAPKVSVPKPPTPEPVYDYESDFESDESLPSPGCSSTPESSGEHTESSNSSSEGGDDEDEDEEKVIPNVPKESETLVVEQTQLEIRPQNVATRTARSVDILSKISLNDITVQLYQFDPEEYAELRTNFGITSTVAYGKHTQTDSSLVSKGSQTYGIAVRDRSTCMHESFRSARVTEQDGDWNDRMIVDEEDEAVQSYSSLQNIERMFSTLNGALERRFSHVTNSNNRQLPSSITVTHDKRNRNPQRSILQLLRRAAPAMEALLESKRFRLQNTNDKENATKQTREHRSEPGKPTVDVVRSFDGGKMSPEFEIKLVHSSESFVLEFWARGTYSRPMYRFSSWSTVVCVDYEYRKHMMVFGGTGDGTLQMWLGDAGRSHNEVLAPHQVLAPKLDQKHKLNCWEMVAVKVLPVPVIRDSSLEIGNENAFNQVFGLFSTGVIVVWNVQTQKQENVDKENVMSAKLGPPELFLVQSKVIDLSNRIGGRLPYDALRTFENLLLHDHHQMVLSSNQTVIRLSHFVRSEFDPVLLVKPDDSHSITNLKRMVQANDTLFVLYSNKTVRVLKLCTEPGNRESAQHRHRKQDDHPHLMLSVCTNKSCTIQSIVHDEAKRYGNTNGAGEGRADGGTIAPKASEPEKGDGGDVSGKPRFHHGQQILFFDPQHPDGILKEAQLGDNTNCSALGKYQKMVSDSQKHKVIREFFIPDTLKDDIAYCQRSLRDCMKVHQQEQVKQYLLELEDEMRAIGQEQSELVRDLSIRLKHFLQKTKNEKHIVLGDDLANGYVAWVLSNHSELHCNAAYMPHAVSERLNEIQLYQKYPLEPVQSCPVGKAVLPDGTKVQEKRLRKRPVLQTSLLKPKEERDLANTALKEEPSLTPPSTPITPPTPPPPLPAVATITRSSASRRKTPPEQPLILKKMLRSSTTTPIVPVKQELEVKQEPIDQETSIDADDHLATITLQETAAVKRGRSNLLQALNKVKTAQKTISKQPQTSPPAKGGRNNRVGSGTGSEQQCRSSSVSSDSSNSRASTPGTSGNGGGSTRKPTTENGTSHESSLERLSPPAEPPCTLPTSIDEWEQYSFLKLFGLYTIEDSNLLKGRKNERKRRSCCSTERKDFHYGRFDYYEQQFYIAHKRRYNVNKRLLFTATSAEKSIKKRKPWSSLVMPAPATLPAEDTTADAKPSLPVDSLERPNDERWTKTLPKQSKRQKPPTLMTLQ
uniref:Uncharacterized protein n=1 Tax=Anopheles culicifacies TaxID=139723 RepID=A0A182LS52_9DIPT